MSSINYFLYLHDCVLPGIIVVPVLLHFYRSVFLCFLAILYFTGILIFSSVSLEIYHPECHVFFHTEAAIM
jgi:hypothetical protein